MYYTEVAASHIAGDATVTVDMNALLSPGATLTLTAAADSVRAPRTPAEGVLTVALSVPFMAVVPLFSMVVVISTVAELAETVGVVTATPQSAMCALGLTLRYTCRKMPEPEYLYRDFT